MKNVRIPSLFSTLTIAILFTPASNHAIADQDPFICEIYYVAFDFAPHNWAKCDGTLLPISEHTALFSLLGTKYGGDGCSTFALPDIRGRVLHTRRERQADQIMRLGKEVA